MAAERRHADAERALVLAARAFLRAQADALDGLRRRARGLRDRLAATEAYRAVDGDDSAADDLRSAAGLLTSVNDDELGMLDDTLREVARRRAVVKGE